MDNNKKILIVSRTIPYPTRGGDLIVLENIIKALSDFEIKTDLLCFGTKEQKPKTLFQTIHTEIIEPKINPRCIFEWIFKQKSYIFNRFYSKKFSQKLFELIKGGEYSTIVFEHTYMYVNLLFNPELADFTSKNGIKTIINTHVLEYFVFEQAVYQRKFNDNVTLNLFQGLPNRQDKFSFITGKMLKRVQHDLRNKEQKYLKKIELECIKHADKTIFMSKEDLLSVKNELPGEVSKFYLLEITPNIENYPYSPPEFEEKNSIYFLGTFSWIQNYNALFYFVNEIFPLILEKMPDIKFYLVGKNANKDIKQLHDGKNIFFIGEIENIFEEIKKYSVLVVPLRLKGGTRIKILESIAWGKAVVSTFAGIEGVCSTENCPVIIADNPQTFADKVQELLSNDELRLNTKQNTRLYAEKYFSFPDFKESVFNIIQM